ncbi:aldo/keto reductase [Rhodobacteraceae bacterium 2376]|uniref:Aldo/keto reductase n=1 Tax=Rhabdonatronobacter sediminivivens TaxID=2743469 RepID=A0A7Z0KZD2_9RHOB|nr:aldo/keto reductase [Rhabdonatronobacter sediminivivens]NYS24293.1 aldo/keto reductase [Rhabdonatronobacter sediminivivens]
MERVELPGGVALSRLVYGMWRLGDDTDTRPAHVQAKIEACLTQGVTTMDQADIYGDYGAEALLGAALRAAPGLRDRLEIVTKCDIVAPVGRYADARVKHYDTSPAHIRASVEASLQHMATDRIDLLLIHRPDPLMDHHATGQVLDALVAEGKLRAVGVSNFRPWDWELLQSAMTTPLATNQIELSLLSRAAFTNGDLAHLQRLGVPPMAWSPLAGGALFGTGAEAARLAPVLARMGAAAGVGADAVAVAWLLAHPARILPVLGTNSLDRIARISDALRVNLDRQDWFELWTAAAGAEVP